MNLTALLLAYEVARVAGHSGLAHSYVILIQRELTAPR